MSTESSIETIEEKSRVTNPPADFSLYHARRDLMAALRAERGPVQRERINMLIRMLENYDRATGMQRLALATAIDRQMRIVAF